MKLLKAISKQKLQSLTLIAIFLFPILMITVKSAVSATYLLLLILSIIAYTKKILPKLTSQEKVVFIGFAIVFTTYLLGMLNSDDMYKGFKKLGKFQYFLFSVPVFLLLKHYRTIILKAFYPSIIIAGFTSLIYILLNNSGTLPYHSIMYGDFSILIMGINMLLSLLVNKNKIYRVLFAFSAFSALSASFIVGARGSWIALPILLLIFVYLMLTQKHLRLKITTIFVGIILTIGISASAFPDKTVHRFNSAISNTILFIQGENIQQKQKVTSTGERIIFWKASIDTLKKQPLFGSGSGDFRLELRRFIKENPQYNAIGDGFGTAHNIFFEWLALFGIAGFLILVITVFLLPLRFFLQSLKNNANNLWAPLIGMWIIISSMVFGLTETWIVRSAPNGVYVLFVLILMAFSTQPSKPK